MSPEFQISGANTGKRNRLRAAFLTGAILVTAAGAGWSGGFIAQAGENLVHQILHPAKKDKKTETLADFFRGGIKDPGQKAVAFLLADFGVDPTNPEQLKKLAMPGKLQAPLVFFALEYKEAMKKNVHSISNGNKAWEYALSQTLQQPSYAHSGNEIQYFLNTAALLPTKPKTFRGFEGSQTATAHP